MIDSTTTVPTIAASEEMDYLYVLADEHAPTRQRAVDVLIGQARAQWGHDLDRDLLPAPIRFWYKTDGDTLKACASADPSAESQWWVFADVPARAVDGTEAS